MRLQDTVQGFKKSSLGYEGLVPDSWFYNDTATTDDGWWLLDTTADFATVGHSSQDMTIWNSRGECVAKGRQMITLFA